MDKIKVFCLPYAGGSKSIYFDWIKKYASVAEIIPIEYNGHGSLFSEPFYQSADEAADDICNRISNEHPQNYIIYGHSMGSLIALLVAVKLEEKGYNPLPKALIVGGMRPPDLERKRGKISHLPKGEFMKEMFDMGQTEPEVMNEPELVDMLYDIFYADIKLLETYVHDKSLRKISIPIVVMTGKKDPATSLSKMKKWDTYTHNNFHIKEFNAGHFFPFDCKEFDEYYFAIIDKAAKSSL